MQDNVISSLGRVQSGAWPRNLQEESERQLPVRMAQGQMDYRLDKQQNQRIESTWHGFGESDELAGRGHAEIVKDELHGHLYTQLGDDSAFHAVRPPTAARKHKSD